jgi:sugar phosphate isomerase/epimerase
VARLLEAIVPKMQGAGLRLAIENHFDISSALLVELAASYPAESVGFCVDTANSLRSFEPSLEVIRLLRERAFCYHLKDYRVVGSMINFSVVGAPLGEGDLQLDACLQEIFRKVPVPPLFVETWTPSENNRERDMALDADWLQRSVRNLNARL